MRLRALLQQTLCGAITELLVSGCPDVRFGEIRTDAGYDRSWPVASVVKAHGLSAVNYPVDCGIAPRISRNERRCRPSWSKFSGLSQLSNAARMRGHSSAITAYQAVSRFRPL